MSDINFPKGFIFKKPHENAPDFVKGKVSIKMDEFIEWARANHKNGWVNIDLKESREGKYYAAKDDFEPKKQEPKQEDFHDDPIPFS